MDGIPPDLFNTLSLAGGVAAIGWMIATGRLATRRECDGIRKDRDDWRSAYENSETGRRLAEQQVTELLEHSRVADALMRGLSEVADREPT